MGVNAAGEPWRKYSKTRLAPGYAHPVGQQDLRAALLDAEVVLGTLDLGGCIEAAWRERRPVRLLSTRRMADGEARKLGEFADAFQTNLTVNACPSHMKLDLRKVVLADALPQVIAWLRAAGQRGNAWGASERQLEVLWEHPGLRYVEDRFR